MLHFNRVIFRYNLYTIFTPVSQAGQRKYHFVVMNDDMPPGVFDEIFVSIVSCFSLFKSVSTPVLPWRNLRKKGNGENLVCFGISSHLYPIK